MASAIGAGFVAGCLLMNSGSKAEEPTETAKRKEEQAAADVAASVLSAG